MNTFASRSRQILLITWKGSSRALCRLNGRAALFGWILLAAGLLCGIARAQSPDPLVITPDGKVGIGTSNPKTELEVNGGIAANSVAVAKTVSAKSFAGNGTIPVGGIIMWSGSVGSIPAGWALCNGQTVNGRTTPNLVDRFVVAAGSSYNPGTTGGSTSVTLSTNNLPSFNVTIWNGTNSPRISMGGKTYAGGGYVLMNPREKEGQGWVRLTGTQRFNNNPLRITPPYYALAFIMRVE